MKHIVHNIINNIEHPQMNKNKNYKTIGNKEI